MQTYEEASERYAANPEKVKLMRAVLDYAIHYGIGIQKFRHAHELLHEWEYMDEDEFLGDTDVRTKQALILVDKGIQSLFNTRVEPLRLHTQYILQQQCSTEVPPEYMFNLFIHVMSKDRQQAISSISVVAGDLDEPCGRTIFYMFKDGDFDPGYEGVVSTVENRLRLAREGHSRQIQMEHIDDFVQNILPVYTGAKTD